MPKTNTSAAPRTVTVEGAQIIFRNFAGKATAYNAAGSRNFCVILDKDIADVLASDGWPVKVREAREEGEEPTIYIKVRVNFDGPKPPNITTLAGSDFKRRTRLDASSVEVLDWAEIVSVDLIMREYQWEVRGDTGISAYVQTMFVKINEDELERKYAEENEDGS